MCDTYRLLTLKFKNGREVTCAIRGDALDGMTEDEAKEVTFLISEKKVLPDGYKFDQISPEIPTVH